MTLVLRQSAVWLSGDVHTPISLFLGLVGNRPGILLESAEVDGRWGRYSLIGYHFLASFHCRDGRFFVEAEDSRFDLLKIQNGARFADGFRAAQKMVSIEPPPDFESLPPMTRGFYGYFSYGMAGILNPDLAGAVNPSEADATLVLPGIVILFDHLTHRLCLMTLDGVPAPDPEQIDTLSLDVKRGRIQLKESSAGTITVAPGKSRYMSQVQDTKALIEQGEAIQVVLSVQFRASFQGRAFDVYRRLRQLNPSPYMFFLRFSAGEILGSSPEALVRCDGGDLTLYPIAGTRRRGRNETEDEALAQELSADPKERAEHVMLVDLGRNDLGRVAEMGTVSVDKYMQIEHFSHVMHLTSTLSARLCSGKDALDVLGASFPAGTVSGAPKRRAMEIIRQTEICGRGPYAGAIGWFGLDRGPLHMDTGILIRSLWIREGQVHWQAGAGIVYDSEPEKEWQECLNKAKIIVDALGASLDAVGQDG